MVIILIIYLCIISFNNIKYDYEYYVYITSFDQ